MRIEEIGSAAGLAELPDARSCLRDPAVDGYIDCEGDIWLPMVEDCRPVWVYIDTEHGELGKGTPVDGRIAQSAPYHPVRLSIAYERVGPADSEGF